MVREEEEEEDVSKDCWWKPPADKQEVEEDVRRGDTNRSFNDEEDEEDEEEEEEEESDKNIEKKIEEKLASENWTVADKKTSEPSASSKSDSKMAANIPCKMASPKRKPEPSVSSSSSSFSSSSEDDKSSSEEVFKKRKNQANRKKLDDSSDNESVKPKKIIARPAVDVPCAPPLNFTPRSNPQTNSMGETHQSAGVAAMRAAVPPSGSASRFHPPFDGRLASNHPIIPQAQLVPNVDRMMISTPLGAISNVVNFHPTSNPTIIARNSNETTMNAPMKNVFFAQPSSIPIPAPNPRSLPSSHQLLENPTLDLTDLSITNIRKKK
eukprot:GDKJ01040517.1.p1 GENE.GDKJ01040517.1~~GDKJ01040517.1.p1  ORF type:complete len:324 (-),score=101.35 GDKJ01040517.1:349-1320(-)